jgi:hypothetical protein
MHDDIDTPETELYSDNSGGGPYHIVSLILRKGHMPLGTGTAWEETTMTKERKKMEKVSRTVKTLKCSGRGVNGCRKQKCAGCKQYKHRN